MRHGSLFSGIGGWELACQWMGWENVFHCEINQFGQRVLNYHFPKSISHYDIKETDFTPYRGTIDLLTSSFPCQPFSHAGKRKGTDDTRYLWPETLRAIREIRPRWVIGENVYGIVSWDAGVVFEQVQADLEAEGYEVWTYVLPACGVNAPHRRDRVWFVAYRNGFGFGREQSQINGREKLIKEGREIWSMPSANGSERTITNPDERAERTPGQGSEIERVWGENNDEQELWREQTEQHIGCDELLQPITNPGLFGQEVNEKQATGVEQCCERAITDTDGRRQPGEKHRQTESGRTAKNGIPGNWQNFPTQSPICGGDDGISTRLDGITFPKWRNESIKAYGNAIVPQVAFQLLKTIEAYEQKLIIR